MLTELAIQNFLDEGLVFAAIEKDLQGQTAGVMDGPAERRHSSLHDVSGPKESPPWNRWPRKNSTAATRRLPAGWSSRISIAPCPPVATKRRLLSFNKSGDPGAGYGSTCTRRISPVRLIITRIGGCPCRRRNV